MAGKYEGIEKYIFADMYNALTTYITGDGSDVYWEYAVGRIRGLVEQYESHPLAIALGNAVLNELEFKMSGATDNLGRTYHTYDVVRDRIVAQKMRERQVR